MMMKYAYLSTPIKLEKGLHILVIENKPLFRRSIEAFYNGNEEELFVLSENFVPLNMKKVLCFINDIFELTYSDKRLNGKILSDLEHTANEKLYQEVLTIIEKLYSIGERLSYEYDFDVLFDDSLSTVDIIKLLSFKPRLDTESTIENIIRFMKICKRYLGIKLFVVVGMSLYFEDPELYDFQRELQAADICVLNIENTWKNSPTVNSLYILDRDLCEIVDN